MPGMGWRTTGDVTEFLAVAGDYLRAERVRNTVLLTVTEALRHNPVRYPGGGNADRGEQPLFGWWASDAGDGIGADADAGAAGMVPAAGMMPAAGALGGAFLHTPPFPVVLTAVPAAVAVELAAGTLAGRRLSGINAYQDAATAFGAAWQESTGGRTGVHRRIRLYRRDRLAWPDRPCDGAPRVAGEADAALLEPWFAAFELEGNNRASTDVAAAVRERLSYGGITVWEAAGQPVSIAGITRKVAGAVRVGSVYTPPELRGRGYASAVTAAASQRALDTGAEEVLLYTDLANPVSNSIYQHLGYRPAEDRLELAFSSG